MTWKEQLKIPITVRILVLRLLFGLAFLTLSRIIFYFVHDKAFTNVVFTDWLVGIWFDIVTLCLLLLPFIVFSVLPWKWQNNQIVRFLKISLFVFTIAFILALNFIDTAYFSFTQKRSTSDILSIVSAGNDIQQLLGSFVKDYWHFILSFIILLIGLRFVYRKSNRKNEEQLSLKKEIVWFFIVLAISVFLGRGGTSFRPISPLDASLYTEPQNTTLVLNSAFTILKSVGKSDVEEKNYFSEKILKTIYSPYRKSKAANILSGKPNVMIIMLESFGNEWVGTFNGKETYAPFFDSLLTQSWYFEFGISNGKKSIEAVPTITAGIPSLMNNPFISSPFSNNKFQSLPQILKKFGYSSAFYHGATNGSMRFNSFAKQAGFDDYFGRSEYPNDAHSDKTWGILDEYFNPWTVKQLSKLKQPFCGTLFTLSSHHPYFIPENWQGKVKKGPNPICKSINYADYALKAFFENAKKEPWYQNTIFVLVADHTPATNSSLYNQRSQLYQIPIAFFDPSGKLPRKKEKGIFQQIDIMPTLLDLTNNETNYFSFGNSFFQTKEREGICFLEGTYHFFQDHYLLMYSNDKSIHLYDITKKTAKPIDLLLKEKAQVKKMEKRLKAIIQTYNNSMIRNKLMY